ncbi:MAG: hypothetical protein E6G13_10890 [Actinobacteria bacterium]|nr:MAG: hypothetical protein E6G13_10890 [Actinomycetota bacterium]
MREAGRRAAAAAGVVAVVGLAACGGGSGQLSKSDYEQKLKAEGSQLRSDLAGLNFGSIGTNLKLLGTQLGTAQGKIERTASDIDKLKPPKDAATDNTKIADSLHRFATVFGQMKTAANNGDRAKVAALVSTLRTAAQEGSQATQDLKKKGYTIGAFGQ